MGKAKNVTRQDMEAAAERIALRDGVSIDDVRDRVRNPQRTCARPGCDATFPVRDDRQRYCSGNCKAVAHRLRNGGES